MSAHVEIEEFMTPERVEVAYGKAIAAMQGRRQAFADTGWRAAVARDSKLLKALERGAEVLAAADERQRGRTRRSTLIENERVETTATQLWREAYRTADAGQPKEAYCWVYGAAAWLVGYNT